MLVRTKKSTFALNAPTWINCDAGSASPLRYLKLKLTGDENKLGLAATRTVTGMVILSFLLLVNTTLPKYCPGSNFSGWTATETFAGVMPRLVIAWIHGVGVVTAKATSGSEDTKIDIGGGASRPET